MKPTSEQELIIAETSHRAVLAKPGSGKTFTLSKIIQKELENALDYQGVIAISFTNKASKELEHRSIAGAVSKKSSFFGTIDKFILQEIIFPFLPHFLNEKSDKEINIIKLEEAKDLLNNFSDFSECCEKKAEADESFFKSCLSLSQQGYLILEACPKLALYMFDHSQACKRYFKARYTHIIVDEYQDSGWAQHSLFMRLKNLGLIAIAVGDLDQSIYYFTGKDPAYLSSLISEPDFKTFNLPKNHRSHPSIINYSLTFISKNPQLLPCDSSKIFFKNIQGTQKEIAIWIGKQLTSLENKGLIKQRNEIGILVRTNYSALLIKDNIGIPIKYSMDTKIDTDTNQWSLLFRNLLLTVHDNNFSSFDFVQGYVDEELETQKFRKILKEVKALKRKYNSLGLEQLHIQEFLKIAEDLLPEKANQKSITLLDEVIKSEEFFNSYRPAYPNEVQLMTLHKSKGLEFTIVFHTDLYNYILPSYESLKGSAAEMLQDKNLHYVGITRAKTHCILVSSTQRINGEGDTKQGNISDFVTIKELENLRV